MSAADALAVASQLQTVSLAPAAGFQDEEGGWAAGVQPHTPAPATPNPAHAAPVPAAAPPTPLEQRQWRRAAQTSLRVALTATKAARARAADASLNGTRDLTDLTNQILAAEYLPSRPLGALKDEPGLLEAAAAKLRLRQAAALARLEGSWRQLASAAQVCSCTQKALGLPACRTHQSSSGLEHCALS
jgi:hypothetical protein